MAGVILDQASSVCAVLEASPTVRTLEMKLRYMKGVPLPSVVLCRAAVTRKEGRKLWVRGIVEDGSSIVYCEAETLFLEVKQEKPNL